MLIKFSDFSEARSFQKTLADLKIFIARHREKKGYIYAHNVSDWLDCQHESHYGKIRFGLSPELRGWPGHRALFYATEKFIADAFYVSNGS